MPALSRLVCRCHINITIRDCCLHWRHLLPYAEFDNPSSTLRFDRFKFVLHRRMCLSGCSPMSLMRRLIILGRIEISQCGQLRIDITQFVGRDEPRANRPDDIDQCRPTVRPEPLNCRQNGRAAIDGR